MVKDLHNQQKQLCMRQILFILCSIVVFSSCDTLSNLPGVTTPVSEAEAGQGIREALSQGVSSAILDLNKTDGFFGNQAYKLFLPKDAEKIESTLRKLGMGKQVDKAILQINRAAEDAVGYAKPIFADAIKEMTITDALNIVKGERNAATNYFRDKTRDKLIQAFTPSIKRSLDRLEATRYYGDIVSLYNNLPTTFNKVDPDLSSYVVTKATDALFVEIEKEEANIRENPAARATEILKKVFGRKY